MDGQKIIENVNTAVSTGKVIAKYVSNTSLTKLAKDSIFIIHNDIPCLVIHRENDKECKSISSILYPFQSEENVCGIIYKVHDVREILDILSYDDTNIKFHGNYRPLYSFGCVGTNFGGTY